MNHNPGQIQCFIVNFTISMAVHLQKCSHLSNEIRVMQKKNSISITKQLMPALKVNIIIVHPRGVVFPLL